MPINLFKSCLEEVVAADLNQASQPKLIVDDSEKMK